ncbi:MAG: hypothetical protein KJZ83_20845 [Burkholderiaceae bacterium]|nr:hypothetical protein [Burkholderiaceae bacterium]
MSADQVDLPRVDAPSDRRRRMLRLAAAGAPLLLSSAKVSAQAFGSIGACVEKCSTQTPPIGAVPDSDNWIREIVGVFQVGVQTPGGPVRAFAYKIGDLYYPLDADGSYPYGSGLTPGNPPWELSELVGDQAFVRREAVLVTYSWSSGGGGVTVVRLGPVPSNPRGTPLTVSCMASVAPGTLRMTGRFLSGV